MLSRSYVARVPASLVLSVAALCLSVPLVAASPPSVDAALEAVDGLSFDDFVDACYRQIMLRDPDTVWSYDLQVEYGLESFEEWTDLSREAFEETCRLDRELLNLLRTHDRALLTPGQQLDYDVHEWFLEDRIRLHEFPYWDYVLGPSAYGAQNQGLDLLAILPIESVQDAEDYITRLRGVSAWMDQLIGAFRTREAAGIVPTQFAVDMILAELDDLFPQIPDTSLAGTLGAYVSFSTKVQRIDGLDGATRRTLLADARDAISASLIPAYRSLGEYVSTLADRAGRAGVYDHDRSADYYAALLQHHATKAITAHEIVALGEREVARLQAEMRAYASERLGWPDSLSMSELDRRLTEANVPVLQGQQLLAEYQRIVDEAKAALHRVFDIFPTSDLVITVELDGPPAYYREPPLDGSGPGEIPTSLVNIVPFTAYDEPVLMHHEGVPGHHFQLAIQRDLDLSLLRRDRLGNYYFRHPTFQAFTEGWALYSEPLAHEMGLYDDDPIGGLCQKRLELARLARLVADAGLSALGWSWSEAAGYLLEATGKPEGLSGSLRYDAYPGQACAYDVGYLTLLELRRRAQDALGDAFDLKAFHRVILLNGAIPLAVLEGVIDGWLAGETETD